MSVAAALGRVRSAPFVLDAMAEADSLAVACADSDGPRTTQLLLDAALDLDDQLTGIAAVHGLARVFDDTADAALAALLSHEQPFLREHAAWALGARLPHLDAIGRLVAVVVSGGFPAMVAQRTLQRWAASAADHVSLALEGALAGVVDVDARTRVAETLGLVPGALASRLLRHLATDPDEHVLVRGTAVAAIGDRAEPLDHQLLAELESTLASCSTPDTGAGGHELDELMATVRLARIDLTEGVPGPAIDEPAARTVVQLFLHADIDPGLTQAGAGDNGGIATLLVQLAGSLVRNDEVDRVITMSRGPASAALASMDESTALAPQWFAPVPLRHDATGVADAWPSRIAAERGIRRVLRRAVATGGVDALHLRMADVGSLAALTVAGELSIPTVFTLAPDPHAFIHALDMTGTLPRDRFGEVDQREHFWFRTRLVRRLADDAAHRVLFPRPDLRHELQELLGLDIDHEPGRSTVVPEGIDLRVVEAARADVRAAHGGGEDHDALTELRRLVAGLPAERQGLPLAISVGRLHRVKGMATVAEAWAAHPELSARCNLVIVGGDLTDPSSDEREQLERIDAVLDDHPGSREGVILTGHRPNDVVARWLAAAAHGLAPQVGTGGVYVCGSLKEEFGLALLEALAAGLPVVAPGGGGPATYVEPGVTGVLVDTRDPSEVAAGLHAALDIAPADGRHERAERTVRDRFTIEAMATTLASVYASVSLRPVPDDQRRVGTGMWARSWATTTSSNSSRASSANTSSSG
jgi:glycosyltransferase involved in cell wall biosynthesis